MKTLSKISEEKTILLKKFKYNYIIIVLVILRMFQHEISTEDFRKNVLTYLRRQ